MNRNVTILLFILAFVIAGCQKDKSNENIQTNQSMPPVEVKIYVAKSGDIPISFEFPAKIKSKQDVFVAAKVPGTLIKKNFKAGDFVKEGEELFLIDPKKYQAAFDSTKAALDVANADFKRAELDLQRANKLKTTNAISQKEYDLALSNYYISKAKIQSSKANLKNAEIDLSYTIVKAPFDGVVGDPLIDIGSYINLNNANLVRLTKLNPIDVDFAISEIDSLNINENLDSKQWQQIGSVANLQVEDKNYKGKVIFIDKIIDKKTGTISAKAEFENNNSQLLPGGYAKITMEGFYEKNGYKIPQIVVKQDEKGPYVYILKDGKVSKSHIKISSQNSKEVIVRSGLNDGDKIIMDNFQKIKVGANVVEIRENK